MPSSTDIEFASRDQISILQLERLQWSLKHAYDNVPHYRKAFDAGGCPSDGSEGSVGSGEVPFTTKEDLRGNYPFGMFAVPQTMSREIHASSGPPAGRLSSGTPTTDLDNWAGPDRA